jgi:hypothetical protein
MRRMTEWIAFPQGGPLVTVRRILLLVLLTLSFSTIAAADELQVSFSNVAAVKGIPAFSGTYSGSWLWNTATDTISNVIIQSSGPADFNGPVSWLATFGDPAHAGDLFELSIQNSDQTATLNFDPADTIQFLPPTPGEYDSLTTDFSVSCVSASCFANGARPQQPGQLSVAKVAEPGILGLTGVGLLFLISLVAYRRQRAVTTI